MTAHSVISQPLSNTYTFVEWLRERIVWRDGFRWVLVGKKGQPWVYWPPITG